MTRCSLRGIATPAGGALIRLWPGGRSTAAGGQREPTAALSEPSLASTPTSPSIRHAAKRWAGGGLVAANWLMLTAQRDPPTATARASPPSPSRRAAPWRLVRSARVREAPSGLLPPPPSHEQRMAVEGSGARTAPKLGAVLCSRYRLGRTWQPVNRDGAGVGLSCRLRKEGTGQSHWTSVHRRACAAPMELLFESTANGQERAEALCSGQGAVPAQLWDSQSVG